MIDGFPILLKNFRERNGRSRNGLALQIGVDPSYLTRIEHGVREPPRQHIIIAIAKALRLSASELDGFLVAGGYAPLSISAGGQWEPILSEVADVLHDRELGDRDKEQFRELVHALCSHWRGPSDDLVPRMTR